MQNVLFLPGAGGSANFWAPVAALLPSDWQLVRFAWPGLGQEPHDPTINSIDDLVRLVEARAVEIDEPVDLVAQSMGGPIAIRVALQWPGLVRSLTLVATSGGVDLARFGATDWRPNYRETYPTAAAWITQPHAAVVLPVENIAAPTLLIWGDADAVSPVAVGRHLEDRIPDAKLHIIAEGNHDLAKCHADAVAPLVIRHVLKTLESPV